MAVNNSSHQNNGLRRRDSKDPRAPTTTRASSLADSQAPPRTDAWLNVACLFYTISKNNLTHHDLFQSMDNDEFDDINGPPQDLPRGNRRPDPEGDEGNHLSFSHRDPIDACSRIGMSIGGSNQEGLHGGSGVKRTSGGANQRGKPPNCVSNVHGGGGGTDSIFGSIEDEGGSGVANKKAEFGELMKKSFVDALIRTPLAAVWRKQRWSRSGAIGCMIGLRPPVVWPSMVQGRRRTWSAVAR